MSARTRALSLTNNDRKIQAHPAKVKTKASVGTAENEEAQRDSIISFTECTSPITEQIRNIWWDANKHNALHAASLRIGRTDGGIYNGGGILQKVWALVLTLEALRGGERRMPGDLWQQRNAIRTPEGNCFFKLC